MPEKYGNIGKGRPLSPVIHVWLRLTLISALVLILAGCGGGGSSGNSGSSGPATAAGDGATAQTKTESQSTSEGTSSNTEGGGDTGQVSGGNAGLGTPALGDSGAPVVMVEYADYQ